jgi:hypothetical protein
MKVIFGLMTMIMGIKKRKLFIILITTNFNLMGIKEKRIFKIMVTLIMLIKIRITIISIIQIILILNYKKEDHHRIFV